MCDDFVEVSVWQIGKRMRTSRWQLLFTVALILCSAKLAVAQSSAPNWTPFSWLVGDWVGEGAASDRGQGTGGFSFALDLQKNILIRKNWADYPATNGRAAFRHDDLMVAYQESAKDTVQAIFFDSEGHVIRYIASVSGDGNTIQFTSEVQTSAPRYRLTYAKTSEKSLTLKFEIAPPGKPEAFASYIEATAHRKP
jgi:hypothetical protein